MPLPGTPWGRCTRSRGAMPRPWPAMAAAASAQVTTPYCTQLCACCIDHAAQACVAPTDAAYLQGRLQILRPLGQPSAGQSNHARCDASICSPRCIRGLHVCLTPPLCIPTSSQQSLQSLAALPASPVRSAGARPILPPVCLQQAADDLIDQLLPPFCRVQGSPPELPGPCQHARLPGAARPRSHHL